MKSYFVIFICIIVIFSCNQKSQTKPIDIKPSNQPNILVILTDDQGYHDVSYYGTEDIRTPNIDALAEDG